MVVTIDPEKRGRATKSLAIAEVRSHRTGRIIDARRFIERPTYGCLIRVRSILQEERYKKKVRITCAICGVPVYLVAKTLKDFYFRHAFEDGRCPAVTRSKLTLDQIKAMKYLGARESHVHKETKKFIERSMKADEAFSDIVVEKNWKSSSDPKSRRQPDVQAKFGKMRIAFEVQLSTTFLSVVVGRREFYRGENAMLIWVLRRFDPEDRRLTVDDILFSNNSNILVVDEETVRKSEEQKTFIARGWYREPYLEGGAIRYRWSNSEVAVRDMTFDVAGQRAFHFDAQGRKVELLNELEALAEQEWEKVLEGPRKAFFAFCEGWTGDRDYFEAEDEYFEAIEPFVELGLEMPDSLSAASGLIRRVLALRSIELGKPVGYRYDKLIQVLHTMADSYKSFLYFIGYALKIYGRNGLIEEQDLNRRWKKKTRAIAKAMAAKDPDYHADLEWGAVYRVLFPALAVIPKWVAIKPLTPETPIGPEIGL